MRGRCGLSEAFLEREGAGARREDESGDVSRLVPVVS